MMPPCVLIRVIASKPVLTRVPFSYCSTGNRRVASDAGSGWQRGDVFIRVGADTKLEIFYKLSGVTGTGAAELEWSVSFSKLSADYKLGCNWRGRHDLRRLNRYVHDRH